MDEDEDYIYSLMGLNKMHVDESAARSRKKNRQPLVLPVWIAMEDVMCAAFGRILFKKGVIGVWRNRY